MKRAVVGLLFWIMLVRGLRINRFHFARSRMSMMSKDWPTYLVEFRGTDPAFRFNEFQDAARSLEDGERIAASIQDFTTLVPDMKAPLSPLCCYLKLPSDDVAKEIIQKCATVKRIVDVWGEGKNINELLATSIDTFHKRIKPTLNTEDLRWKLNFDRIGRVGIVDKVPVCDQLHDLCILLGGTVDLKTPNMDLLYSEDCHTYHTEHIALAAKLRAEREALLKSSTTSDTTDSITTIPATEEPFRAEKLAGEQLVYTPLNYYFGRVVAEGPRIFNKFELRARPFVGTTTMNAMCSHICAVAAQIQPGQRVLDPFCGTGSLLVAAANLGADVVGSDIDADGLLGGGMTHNITHTNTYVTVNNGGVKTTTVTSTGVTDSMSVLPPKKRSKNVNFQRKNGQSQLGLCTMDNFKYYNMQDRVLDLVGVGVDQWLCNTDGSGVEDRDVKILKYDKFDAIVADPPFGRRERLPAKPTHTGDSSTGTGARSSVVMPASMMVDTATLKAEIIAKTSVASTTTNTGAGSSTSAIADGVNSVDGVSVDSVGVNGSSDVIEPLFTPAVNMGDNNSDLLVTLLQVSMCRLVEGGRLVLWLPSKADTPANVVEEYLNCLIDAAEQKSAVTSSGTSDSTGESVTSAGGSGTTTSAGGKPELKLKLKRVTAETLNDSLWRWLCVFKYE